MKIVQVSPYAMTRPGGVQTHIRDLATWFETAGHEVRIVAPPGSQDGGDILEIGKFRTMSMHGTQFEITRASGTDLQACEDSLASWGAEVVHLHTPWTPMLPWQVWKRLNLPTVATFHATLPDAKGIDPMAWFLRRAARYFNKRLQGIVVPSTAPQAQWKALGATPVPDVLAPTLDLSAWRDAGTQAPQQDGLHVVYMGRLEERKGVHVLLEAWQTIAALLPSATLTIAGHGPQEDALRNAAADMGLKHVEFIPPPPFSEARRLVASADIFAAPALYGESFGLVLIEAMAAGTLPVAAANAGFSTVMTDLGQHLLVPPDDATALAEKIVEIACDHALRQSLLGWAAKRANGFDVTSVGPQYLNLYQKALSLKT